MTSNNSYPPSVPLCRLYEKTAKSGRIYLAGRLGGARVSVLKSDDLAEDGSPIWNVMLAEAPQRPQEPRREMPAADQRAARNSQAPL